MNKIFFLISCNFGCCDNQCCDSNLFSSTTTSTKITSTITTAAATATANSEDYNLTFIILIGVLFLVVVVLGFLLFIFRKKLSYYRERLANTFSIR